MAQPNAALVTYANVRNKYFGEVPTQLSIEELTKVLYTELEDTPILDLAIVMMLVTKDHKQLHTTH